MARIFPLSASVSLNNPGWWPFPLDTNDYRKAADYLKSLTYDMMEVHVRDPKQVDGAALMDYCAKIDFGISSIGTGQGYTVDHLCITSPDKENRKEAIQRLKDQLDLASVLKAPIVVGSMRGVIGERSFEEVDALMVESMKELCDHAEKTGTEIVIEAIDRFETDYLFTTQDVVDLIERVGSHRCKVHLDTYHMNLEEQSWRQAVLCTKGKAGHVHVADNRRYYPGWGVIEFRPIIEYLMEIGYDRTLTVECYPYPDSETALVRSAKYLDAVMEQILLK